MWLGREWGRVENVKSHTKEKSEPPAYKSSTYELIYPPYSHPMKDW